MRDTIEISKVKEGGCLLEPGTGLRRGDHSWNAHGHVICLQAELNKGQGLECLLSGSIQPAQQSPDVRGLHG